jgi:hypothetical protein
MSFRTLLTRRKLIHQALGIGVGSAAFGDLGLESRNIRAPVKDDSSRAYLFVASSRDVMGVLLAGDLIRHQNSFEGLRKKHSYYLKLKFKSTNRFQVSYAVDVISYFLEEPDLSFVAHVPLPKSGSRNRNTDVRTITDLHQVELQEQRLREVIQLGLELRPDLSHRELYLDVLSPGRVWRTPIKTFLLRSVKRLSYLREDVVAGFPKQTVPYTIRRGKKTRRSHVRQAPNNTGDLASFLTGCAVALQAPPLPGVRQRERQALADRLQIHGTDVDPLRKNRKFRLVLEA